MVLYIDVDIKLAGSLVKKNDQSSELVHQVLPRDVENSSTNNNRNTTQPRDTEHIPALVRQIPKHSISTDPGGMVPCVLGVLQGASGPVNQRLFSRGLYGRVKETVYHFWVYLIITRGMWLREAQDGQDPG